MSQMPLCPLMSAGLEIPKVCLEDSCAWYLKGYKTCSVYILAHNAALDIKQKQSPQG